MFSFLVWDFERFNPRSREGSDEIPPPTRGNATLVSIHAPAKGATSGTVKIADAEQEFQSTLPRRERLEALEDLEILTVVSIHAPAKGATQLSYGIGGQTMFQSTLPRRERQQ